MKFISYKTTLFIICLGFFSYNYSMDDDFSENAALNQLSYLGNLASGAWKSTLDYLVGEENIQEDPAAKNQPEINNEDPVVEEQQQEQQVIIEEVQDNPGLLNPQAANQPQDPKIEKKDEEVRPEQPAVINLENGNQQNGNHPEDPRQPQEAPQQSSYAKWLAPFAILSPTMVIGGAFVGWLIYLKCNKSILEKNKEALISFHVDIMNICAGMKSKRQIFSLRVIELFNNYQPYLKKLNDEIYQELANLVNKFAEAISKSHGKSSDEVADIITPSFNELINYIEHTCLKDIHEQIANQKIGKSKVWTRVKTWYEKLTSKIVELFDCEE